MDAKLRTGMLCLFMLCSPQILQAATARSANFVVTAPTPEIAQSVAKCAETWRKDLAVLWLGDELPNWNQPCPVYVKVGQIGAGGSTTFTFDQGEVFDWNMKVQGTLERILDSVIPHEVNHTIFATHFRRPLPRWADEGAATLVEHISERSRQTDLLNQVIRTPRRIPLTQLLNIREYPTDMQQVLTLYAEGYSLAEFLVSQKGGEGRIIFLQFLEDAHRKGWEFAFQKYYGQNNLQDLEKQWTGWVLDGSPALDPNAAGLIAGTNTSGSASEQGQPVVRSQSPDRLEPLPMIGRELRTVGRSVHRPDASQSMPSQRNANVKSATRTETKSARGDAGASRLRSNPPQAQTTALPRTSLTPTADGISSHSDAMSYRFPKVRAF